MLTVDRSLALAVDAGRELPRVPELRDLYDRGTIPRFGQTIMIAGRSGSQKSGFALWYTDRLNLPTMYFSADMSQFTASARVTSSRTGLTTEEIERIRDNDELEWDRIRKMARGSKIHFSFGSPITAFDIEAHLEAYLDAYDMYPPVIVYDNLMDFEDAQASYEVQMAVMQFVNETRDRTGSTVIILHHASDKSQDARNDPWAPPSRAEVKNGMSEKPDLTLGVALNSYTNDFNIATIKQRMGPQDPTGRTYISLTAKPAITQFHTKQY